MSTYPIEAIRADFPILASRLYGKAPLIYLDSAASSQKPRRVLETLQTYYSTQHANVHRGLHLLSETATAFYESARDKVQAFLNTRYREEILFTRNSTEGLNLVAASWGRANLQAGDSVLLGVAEHHSNLVPWQMLAQEKGFTLHYLPVNPETLTYDEDAYYRLLETPRLKLVSLTQVSNVLGFVTPLEAWIPAAHRVGALFCVDAAQSVPHRRVDVQALDADFLAFSGHKACGPTGIGILYGKRELLEAMPPYMGGGDMIRTVTLAGSRWNDLPYKFEAGTPAIAEAIGLGAALDYLTEVGVERIQAHVEAMTAYAHGRLAEVPNLRLFAPSIGEKTGVATFTLGAAHPHDIAQMLDSVGVAVRAGHHCAQPLHAELGLTASTRASFYLYTTRAEIDTLAETLPKIAALFN
jgi:cysteine desulfurase/selenocysteine lyase